MKINIIPFFFILLFVFTTPAFATQPNQKCFKILRYTFCIPLPPKPPSPPVRPTVTPKKTPTPTSINTPTHTPTHTPTPTPTPTPNTECNSSTICGNSCLYGEVTYDTVLIGTQCWFKKNLNVGNIITVFEVPDNNAPISNNPDSVQKWCYNDDPTNCTNEGGLYSWAETNGLPHSCNSSPCNIPVPNQGICPAGWHIPTDSEFYTLENFLTDPGQTCDALRSSWDCYGAGTKLSLGGSSGFDAIRAGDHETNGELSWYDKREPSIHFWSSSPCLNCSNWSHGFSRSLINGGNDPYVARGWGWMVHGISVRCLADTTNTP